MPLVNHPHQCTSVSVPTLCLSLERCPPALSLSLETWVGFLVMVSEIDQGVFLHDVSGSIKLALPLPVLEQMTHCCLSSLEGGQKKRISRSQSNPTSLLLATQGQLEPMDLLTGPASLRRYSPVYSVGLARPSGGLGPGHVWKTFLGGAHGDLCFLYCLSPHWQLLQGPGG